MQNPIYWKPYQKKYEYRFLFDIHEHVQQNQPPSSETFSALLFFVMMIPSWLIGFWSKYSSTKYSKSWKEMLGMEFQLQSQLNNCLPSPDDKKKKILDSDTSIPHYEYTFLHWLSFYYFLYQNGFKSIFSNTNLIKIKSLICS